MEEVYLSGRELAQIIDAPIRTIENWAAAGKVRQDEAGKYGLISAFKYRVESLKVKLKRSSLALGEMEERQLEGTKSLRERKLRAEADKEEALARIKNLDADKLEGKLVDAQEVKLAWESQISACKAKFLALPAKLALELSGLGEPDEIQERLRIAIDEGLFELASDS